MVPAQGSVGASGDLAPLAHLALSLLGEGFAEYAGEVLPGGEALRRVGLSPIGLEAKEGLALINGTQAMTALGLLTLADALSAVKVADVALAMSLEAIKGSLRPFFPQVFRLRPHPGAARMGENVLKLCQGSEIMRSHENCPKVQDPYSFRAVPQVHSASRDALEHALEVLLREVNAVTDNPLLLPEEDLVLSAGNFHGQPVALAMDYAKIALAEPASISERRTEKMLDPAFSGLPAFLAAQGGLHSGLMISQYTAASLVSKNKVLAHPASGGLHPHQRQPGGPRVHGHHGCPPRPHGPGEPAPRAGHRGPGSPGSLGVPPTPPGGKGGGGGPPGPAGSNPAPHGGPLPGPRPRQGPRPAFQRRPH